MAKVLVVDDEKNIVRILTDILQDENHIVNSCENGKDMMDFLKKNVVDVILLDVWLPDSSGLELLENVKKISEAAVIMISGHASIDAAVKSTKMGAYDFMEKPLSMERVVTVVKNASEALELKKENQKLKELNTVSDEMIGISEEINKVKDIIERAASTNARVFITGANGTGKELVARSIYSKSSRKGKPFIKVNCAAIPDELIESELFGHEKGAFTGAVSKKQGKFEIANGGTLFLDEICDMSLSAQAKVLRVLQEEELERVGGHETVKVDVRIIAATNVDIPLAIKENRFREDLYYRLNVVPIYVPKLAERKDDIPLIVNYYLKKFSKEHGIVEKELDDSAVEYLMNYPWPGNIRELKNIIERVSIMVPKDTVTKADIEDYIDTSNVFQEVYISEKSNLKQAKEEFEKSFIQNTLKLKDGNVTAAAKELGIERTNLHRKIKQYNIDISNME